MSKNKSESTLVAIIALTLLVGVVVNCNLPKYGEGPSPMYEGSAMAEAAAAFRQKLGGAFKALNVQIDSNSVTLRAQDPGKPANVDEYQYWATSRSLSGPRPVELSSLEIDLDRTLFDFDSVNWSATESLARAAIEQVQIDGGKVAKMTVERGLKIGSDVTKSGTLTWTVDVKSSREHASAYADAQGNIVTLDLSHTARAAKFNLFEPDALRKAVSQINAAFGGHAKVMAISLRDKGLQFKAPDPKTGDISHFSYDLNGLAHNTILDLSGPDTEVARLLERHKLDEILFELDSIKLEQAPEFGRRARQRLAFENASLESVEIKRDEQTGTTKLITVWEVSCQAGRKWGTVWYDLNGKELGIKTW